jgi:hypothetical protein
MVQSAVEVSAPTIRTIGEQAFLAQEASQGDAAQPAARLPEELTAIKYLLAHDLFLLSNRMSSV